MPPGTPVTKKDTTQKAGNDSVPLSPAKKNYTHIFSQHELKVRHREEIQYDDPTPVWPAFVLLLPIALLVYLRVTYAKKLNGLFKAFFSLQASRQLEREDYRLTRRTSVILSFTFLTAFSFFLFKYNQYYPIVKIPLPPFVQFNLFFAGVLLMYLIKFSVNNVLGFILGAPNEIHEYTFTVFLSNQGLGIFLLPVSVCLQYLQYSVLPLFVAGFALIFIFYILRLVKGVIIAMEHRSFSVFHLFLYLCALEILPLIVLITFLMRLNSWSGV